MTNKKVVNPILLKTARHFYSRSLTSFVGAADVVLSDNNREHVDHHLDVVAASVDYFRKTPNARQQLEEHYNIRVDLKEISDHITELKHPLPGLKRIAALRSNYMARLNVLN
ncbi:MAG: hypothetical protein WCK29_02070 [archaeon]